MLRGVNILLMAIVVALAIALVTVTLAPPPPITGAQTAYREYCAKTKDCDAGYTKSLWIPEDSTGFFTLWIALFTAVLAVGTLYLWDATKKSINLASDEFRATHRPKIRLKHIWLNSDIWSGEPIVITMVVVNTGAAEARLQEVGVRYEIVRDGWPLPPAPDIAATLRAGGAPLRSGFNYRFPLIDIGRVLSAAENTEILNGRSKLYCVGYVSYLDAAERMRITGFCRILTFPPNSLALAINSRFSKFDDPDYEYED